MNLMKKLFERKEKFDEILAKATDEFDNGKYGVTFDEIALERYHGLMSATEKLAGDVEVKKLIPYVPSPADFGFQPRL